MGVQFGIEMVMVSHAILCVSKRVGLNVMTSYIWQALGMLFVAFTSYRMVVDSKSSKDTIWRNVLLAAIIFGCIRFIYLGTTSDENCDPDPIYGGCSAVQEFEPSTDQRITAGAKSFVWFLIPISAGAYLALLKRKDSGAETKDNI